jgi:hypothetical protein
MSLGSFMVRDLHVASSNVECIRHVLRKMKPAARKAKHREARHAILRDALKAHQEHRELCRRWHL